MLKIKSKYFSKSFILLALLANLLNISSPLILTTAYAQEISEETTLEVDIVTDESESQDEPETVEENVDEIVVEEGGDDESEVLEEQEFEEDFVEEKVENDEEKNHTEVNLDEVKIEIEEEKTHTQTLDQNASIETLSKDGWEINEDENVAETKENVKLGIRYEFPLDDKVSVTFRSLPTDDDKLSKLKIERVKTSELNFPETDRNYSEFSYDITTDMENGTFEYELSLPNVGENVEVVYVEKSVEDAKSQGISKDDVKSVDENKVEMTDDLVTVEDLNHFTIFTTTNSINETKGWAHVVQLSKGVGTTDLKFISTRAFWSCFEYRVDNEPNTVAGANPNPAITDGRWTQVCVNNSETTKTILANEFVDVRMVYGAEADERFDWTRFEVDQPVFTETRICHANNGINGFVSQSPNTAGQLNGHVGESHQEGRDIIPPIPFYLPDGQNWDELGQAIWNNNCSEDITKVIVNKTTQGGDDTFGFNLISSESEVSEEFDITTVEGEGTYSLYVPAGNDYVLTEDSKEAWLMLSNSCIEPFSLVKGQNLTCEVVNEKKNIQTQCIPGVNMVENGNFESPVVSHSANWDIYPSSNPSIGWDVSWLPGAGSYNGVDRPENAHVELHKGVNGWNPKSGNQYAELDSDWDGPSGSLNGEPASVSLKQTLGTIPGYQYEIKYSFSARPGTPLGDNKLVSNWDGSALDSHSGVTGANTTWTEFTYTKTATNNTTELEFKDDGTSNSLGTFLDEVSVKCLGPSETKVSGMKYNDINGNGIKDDGETGLSGWTIKAVEGDPVDTVVVDSTLIGGNNSSLLSAGDYMIVVNGTFEYKSPETNMYVADAEYSSVDAWSTYLDGATGYTGAGVDSNDIMIESNFVEWGPFDTATHTYYANYELLSDQELNFSVFDGDVDTDVKNPGWYGDNEGSVTVTIYKVIDVAVTDSDGKYELSIPSEYESKVRVYEIPQRGWKQTAPSDLNYCDVFSNSHDVRVLQGDNNVVIPQDARVCNFGNTQIQEQSRTYQIHAAKIVCTDESQLPNWGLGGPDITATTAQDWVSTHTTCSFAKDWQFQYSLNGNVNPGDNTPAAEEPWVSFPSLTDENGTTSVSLTETPEKVEVREVLKEGYLDFTYNQTDPAGNDNNVSAEMYCHNDVLNYDNWDFINNPEVGNNYYCVAFNVLEELQCKEEPGWADVSVSGEQGKTKNGGNVLANRSNLDNVLGAADFEPTDNAVNTFFALGFGGTATFEFSRQVLNVDGNDLSFHEGTNGNRNGYPEETALIEVSQNGTEWFEVGSVSGRSNEGGQGVDLVDFDSTGLSWVKFVRVTDTSNPALFENSADGYDLDAIGATKLGCGDLPGDNPGIDVLVCKYNEQEETLSGWDIQLLGEQVYQQDITPTGTVFSSDSLVTGDYVVLANGTYKYRNPNLVTDANYSERLESDSVYGGPFVPFVDVTTFPSGVTGWLGVMINNSPTSWNDYNSLHRYAKGFTNYTGPMDFRILDDQYSDNVGSINIAVHKGYAGTTGENGCFTLENVKPGDYVVNEVLKDGWENVSGLGEVNINAENTQINVVNRLIEQNDAKLTIEKFNNVNDGAILARQGDNIKFTIKVQAKEGAVKNVTVTDLPPLGFDPLEESFKVTSSINGDVTVAVGNPSYASPGDWNLGNLQQDEEITIEYEARISDSQQAGLYKTLAFAQGSQGQTENVVLAEALAVGNIGDENFVGTSIRVDAESLAPEAEGNVDVDEKVKIKEIGSVLGASIMPATGSNFGFTLLGVTFVLFGLLVKFRKYLKRSAQIAMFMIALSFLALTKVDAAALNARLYEPNDDVNSPFKLDFVVLSMNQSDFVEVDCYVKKPGEGSFSVFETVNLIAGGTSSSCNVDNSVLTTSSLTPYEFYVVATQGLNTATSETVDTRYDSVGPNKPENFDVERDNSCKYDIEFRTANDGQTAKVEVYRSTNNVFLVNNSTRVKTIVIGPNTEHSFTDTVSGDLCGEVNYYALRAFDSAGNASDVTNQDYDETSTTTVTVTTSSSSGSTTGGGTDDSVGGIGEAILIEEGSGAVATPTDEEGAVAGTTDEEGNPIEGLESGDTDASGDNESKPSVLGDSDEPFNWWIVLGILGAGVVGYVGYKYFAKN